jgi:ankyrin repeat protein
MAKQIQPKPSALATLIPELQWLIFNCLSFDDKVLFTEIGLFHPDLLTSHGQTNTYDQHGRTLLHVAAEKGCVRAAQHLLCGGATPSAKMGPGARDFNTTPLILAAQQENKELVNLLLSHGADVNDWDYSGITALHYAVIRGDGRIVRILLDKGAKQTNNYDIGCPVHVAAASGALEILRLLVAHGADVGASKRGLSALDIALLNGNIAAARILVDAGAPLNDPVEGWGLFNPTLMVAGGPHAADAAEIVLDHSIASIDSVARQREVEEWWKPRQKGEYAELLQAMLVAGADPNQTFRSATPLHLAVVAGNEHAVRVLLEAGADVHARTDRGRSAYLLSCLFHYVDIHEQLCSARKRGRELADPPAVPVKPGRFSASGL